MLKFEYFIVTLNPKVHQIIVCSKIAINYFGVEDVNGIFVSPVSNNKITDGILSLS